MPAAPIGGSSSARANIVHDRALEGIEIGFASSGGLAGLPVAVEVVGVVGDALVVIATAVTGTPTFSTGINASTPP
jgi:hypothetical protein